MKEFCFPYIDDIAIFSDDWKDNLKHLKTLLPRKIIAIIFAIKKLMHYIDGQKFFIETDYNPLVFLKKNAGNDPRIRRWALTQKPYQYAIKQHPGKDIPSIDCLSRLK